MQSAPNVSALGACNAGQVTSTSQSTTVAFPQILQVESDYCPNSQGSSPPSCPGSLPGGVDAAQAIITYYTAALIPIPGLLAGQLKITRTALMQVNPSADF
jgi:hypothetical protein